MEINTGIIDYDRKEAIFNFQGQEFVVDLAEGDLHDSWNSIIDREGFVWDFNFAQENIEEAPGISIYKVVNGEALTDEKNTTSIKIVETRGNILEYFKDYIEEGEDF